MFSAVRPLDAFVEKEGWLSVAKSIVDSSCPEKKGYVRANLNLAGFILEKDPNDKNLTKVIYVAQIDPMGNIPGFIINMIATSQPMVVSGMRDIIEKEKKDFSHYVDPVLQTLDQRILSLKQKKAQEKKEKLEKERKLREILQKKSIEKLMVSVSPSNKETTKKIELEINNNKTEEIPVNQPKTSSINPEKKQNGDTTELSNTNKSQESFEESLNVSNKKDTTTKIDSSSV